MINRWLAKLDRWMASSPWHPRVTPFFVYILFLMAVFFVGAHLPWAYPGLYAVQCGLVAALLWRYRELTPELTVRFHWLAVPTGLGLLGAWVALGYLSLRQWPSYLGGPPPSDELTTLQQFGQTSQALMWTALIFHLLGMTLIVPLFEELFIRSAMLRGLNSSRRTGTGLLQLLSDMPLIDELIQDRPAVERANAQPPMLTQQLRDTPVGRITVFGVAASTVVFAASHVPRDWLGCFACGVVWCWLLWYTNRSARYRDRPLGLGPVVWSHGITNAALWAYTLMLGDWRFL